MLWQMMEGMNSLGNLHKTRGLLLLRGQALPGIQHCGRAKGLTVWCLPGCRYWDEFHTCALTVLWECQKEAAAIWEMLRRESRKTKFQGSLFDLCSPFPSPWLCCQHITCCPSIPCPNWLRPHVTARSVNTSLFRYGGLHGVYI